MFCATADLNASPSKRPWKEVRPIVDKVHRHVCGHSNYTDIKTFLRRSNLWDCQIDKYLRSILESCDECRITALPNSSRKVSLSSMSREFHDVVCLDHMFLEEHCVLHVMDTKTRYSAGMVVSSTCIYDAIEAFESIWL